MTSNPALKKFKLPLVVAADVQPEPLESLYSPQINKLNLNDRHLERDSVAVSEFNDIALDDDAFSPVALTAQPGATSSDVTPFSQKEVSNEKTTGNNTARDEERRDTSTTPTPHPGLTTLMDHPKSHKKTASTITIRSTHNKGASLLVNRLDLQEPSRSNRGSVDGHLKLQEEFLRLHENQKDHSVNLEAAIDWGEPPFFVIMTIV